MTDVAPWVALAGLGAFHGLNPAMGWLFAVGLGLQRGTTAAVFLALPPIALGHAGAIALVIVLAGLAAMAVDFFAVQILAALCLIVVGFYRMLRGYRHKFRAGMQAGFADLTVWSFFMATAHGAGLMVAPVLLAMPAAAAVHGSSHDVLAALSAVCGGSIWIGFVAVIVHTVAMLVVAGAIAWVIFAWVGLAILRRGWINLDILWSAALIVTGVAFLVLTGAT